MKRRSAATLLLCVVMLLAMSPSRFAPRAQAANAPVLSGAELEKKSLVVLNALQQQSPEKLFESLAHWRRNEITLHRVSLGALIQQGKVTWPMIQKTLAGEKGLDPKNEHNLSGPNDLAKLSDAELFGLFWGFKQLSSNTEAKQQLAQQWLVVGRVMGPMDAVFRDVGGLAPISEQGGQVTFRNADAGSVYVRCAADADGWHVVDVRTTLKDFSAGLIPSLDRLASCAGRSALAQAWDPRVEEGEQLVFSSRGLVRVAAVQTGNRPKSLSAPASEGGAGLGDDDISTDNYTLRDAIYGNDKVFVLVAEPKRTPGTWIIVVDAWTGSGGTIMYLDTKEEVEARLAALEKNNFKTEG